MQAPGNYKFFINMPSPHVNKAIEKRSFLVLMFYLCIGNLLLLYLYLFGWRNILYDMI